MLPCCIKATVDNPFTTRVSVNKYTGNTATVFYTEKGAYVVVDDITHEIIQVSENINMETWAPDQTIIDPYVPCCFYETQSNYSVFWSVYSAILNAFVYVKTE